MTKRIINEDISWALTTLARRQFPIRFSKIKNPLFEQRFKKFIDILNNFYLWGFGKY